MGLFDHFPYTNFHELNLSWILEAFKEIETTMDQFVAINALKYADPIQWNIVRQYEKNTIVIDPITGTAYISVQPVPSGVSLTNTDSWSVVFDLGSFVVRAAKNFTSKWEEETTLTATFPSSVNDWLIWGDTLYRVISPIVAGDQYVIDSNIEHFTIETIIGHLEDLGTIDKTNLVAAINEVQQTLTDKIGDLANLDTIDKSNVVAAINSVLNSNREIIVNVKDFGAIGNGVHDDIQAIRAAIDYLKPNGGTIYFPAGDYAISDTIFIGDGTARTTSGLGDSTNSTYSNIKFKGVGCDRTLPNTMISQIRPTQEITAVILIDGRITNIELDGLCLYANGLAHYGIFMCAASHCRISNIYIWNALNVGIQVTGGSLPTGNYCNFNYYENIIVAMGTNNSRGLVLDGVLVRDNVSVSNDVWLNTFVNCRFQCAAGVLNTIAGVFMVTDHCTFIRCHFVGDDPTSVGVLFSAANSAETNPFPMGLSFIDCSILNYQMQDIPADNLYCGKQYFLGAGYYDNEQIPRNDKMYGFDVSGRFFGGFGCARIYDYDDLLRYMSVVPNEYCIMVMLSPTFSSTYLDHSGYFAGVCQRISDQYVQLNVHDNVRSCYAIFDITNASRKVYGISGQYINLSSTAEISALSAVIIAGESLDLSLMPAFMNTYFGLRIGFISSAKVIKTSTSQLDVYINCGNDRYWMQIDPTSNTIVDSGNIKEINSLITSNAELLTVLSDLAATEVRTVALNDTMTNSLFGITTQSQATIFNIGGGAAQIEAANNVGLYYARVLISDGSIVQSGSITFNQNS